MVILVLAVVVATLIISATVSVFLERLGGVHIPSIGTLRIIGLEAFGGDLKTGDNGDYLDWGTVPTGGPANRSFSIRSKISVETTLDFVTGNWTFFEFDQVNVTERVLNNINGTLESYMNVTWDADGKLIEPGGSINVTLTMHVSDEYYFVNALFSNEVQGFSFDINIEPNV